MSVINNSTQDVRDNWQVPSDCKQRMICIGIGVALTAIAAVATYFCLVHGLTMLDTASTSLLKFGAAFLIYSGVAFSFVAVGNALYVGGKLLCNDESKEFKYTPNEVKMQVALSIFAPIAVIPVVIVLALGALRK